MSGFERQAQELLSRLLAGRHLSADLRLAIEQAIAVQMRDGFTSTMEAELRHFIDSCAEAAPSPSELAGASSADDDDRSTSVDVHWTTLR